MKKNAWDNLTRPEKQLLAPVLLQWAQTKKISLRDELQAATTLSELLQSPDNYGTPAEKLLTVRNLAQQLGAIPGAWGQMREIVGVARGYLEIRVASHQEFLHALQAAHFVVNAPLEKIGRWFGHGHRFDSARARTWLRHEPQLHLVNDRADEPAYGPNYFFVHWDAQSIFATQSAWLSKIPASLTHRYKTATPQEVANYLQRRSLAAAPKRRRK